MRKEFEADEEEAVSLVEQEQTKEELLQQDREEMARSRQADNAEAPANPDGIPVNRISAGRA